MQSSYVYILLCSDKTYYTGITNNPERRLFEHHSGFKKNSYTFSRRPVEMVFLQEFMDINQAILFEKKIKKWSKAKKAALIEDNYEILPILSKKCFKK
ncbi:MAG: GIY-YIG nuclease family protein [Flavobacteriaceae bacterium]|nr:GIY-YIG nuclease family protein [Flavobacteriaceae bacterium]